MLGTCIGIDALFDPAEADKPRSNSSLSAPMFCGKDCWGNPGIKGGEKFIVFFIRPRLPRIIRK